MDEVNKIRKAFFTDGESRNQLAKRFHRSWDTINRIVNMPREELAQRGKHLLKRPGKIVTPEVIEAIEGYFKEEIEKGVKKKQRYTAKQIYEDLKHKGIYKGSRRRIEQEVKFLRDKYKHTEGKAFLPLEFPLGSALEIDHGEVDLEIEETRIKGYLFVASAPGQVLRFCQIFPTKASEAWGEFHERTFNFFKGTFPRMIYDNDSVLVKQIIGGHRKQTNFSLSLEEHYGFESHFCNVRAGNEKGAVENAVGYCRRRFFSGCPSFENWESVNNFLSTCCTKDIEQGKHYKTHEALSDLFEKTREKLHPLPPPKKWCRWACCRVDKCQLVTIDHHQYSVPEKFIGSQVRLAITTSEIEMFKDEELIVTHKRQYGKEDVLKLDHYLDQLLHKPAAFSYSKAVSQHNFHPQLLEIWSRLSEKYGGKEANRQFVSILLLRRKYTQEELLNGVRQALHYGAVDHAAVETIIHQAQMSESHLDEEEIQRFIPAKAETWEFDLSPYAELCQQEVAR